MTRLKSPEMERIQAARRQKAATFFKSLLPWPTVIAGLLAVFFLAVTFLVFNLLPPGAP